MTSEPHDAGPLEHEPGAPGLPLPAADLDAADPGETLRPPDAPPPSALAGLVLPGFSVDGLAAEPPPRTATRPDTRSDGGPSVHLPGAADETVPLPPLSGGDDGSGAQTLPLPAPTAAASSAAPGASAALYELLEEIGRGGMGVVYRARQRSLEREVAVKRVRGAEAHRRQRFLAEALVTGRLDHPNIVPVYDLGQAAEGEVYLAMKLVEGGSWKHLLHPPGDEERARARRYTLSDHLQILTQVARAAAFAHSRGIVHNDLKPENVMLGPFGEVLLTDWGLAVDVREGAAADPRLPHKDALRAPFGTPAYMAPEQARGEGAAVGPWTDVFLLGAILHELLTGAPPHRGSTRASLSRAVACRPPELGPGVPPELAAITRKAMAAAPAERYPDAAAFAEALGDYLRHRESRAVEEAAERLLARATRALGADGQALDEQARTAAYGDLAAAVAGFAQARALWAENAAAAAGERRARLAYARAALSQGDLGLAAAQLAPLEAAEAPGDEVSALQRAVASARADAERAARAARWTRGALVGAAALIVGGLATGFFLVRAERDRATAGEQLARAETERAEWALGEARRRLGESLLAEGESAAAAARWTRARARFEEARGLLAELGQDATPAEVGLWGVERRSPRPLHVLTGHEGGARGLAFAGEETLLSVGEDAVLRAWDPLRGRALAALPTGQGANTGVAATWSGARALTAGADGSLVLWDLPARREVARLAAHRARVTAVAASPQGALFASGAADGGLAVWSSADGAALGRLDEGHTSAVSGLALTPRYAFAPSARGGLGWWNVPGGGVHWRWGDATSDEDGGVSGRRPSATPPAPPPAPGPIAFHPLEARFALACADGSVRVWSFEQAEVEQGGRRQLARNNYHEVGRLLGHAGAVTAVAWTPDGERLVSGGVDGTLRVWQVAFDVAPLGAVSLRSSALAALAGHEAGVAAVAIDPRGRWLASAGREGALAVWDLPRLIAPAARDPLARRLAGHAAAVSAAAFSPDGRLAASGASDGSAAIWDVASGARLIELPPHGGRLEALALPSGRELVAAGGGAALLWDLDLTEAPVGRVASPNLAGPLTLLSAPLRVASLSFESSPDHDLDGEPDTYVPGELVVRPLGRGFTGDDAERGEPGEVLAAVGREAVAVGRPDGQLALHALTGARIRELTAHARPITALAADPPGRLVLSGDAGGALLLHDLAAGSVRELPAHADAVRALAFAPDRRGEVALAASGGADGRWRLWAIPAHGEPRELLALGEQGARIDALALGPDGRVLSGGADGSLWLHDLGALARERALEPTLARARAALATGREAPGALAVLGRALAARGASEHAAALLEEAARAGEPVDLLALAHAHWLAGRRLPARAALRRALEAQPADRAHLELCLRALEAELAARGSDLLALPDMARAVVCSPDGRWVAAADRTGRVELVDLATGLIRRRLVRGGTDPEVFALAFSPDGRTLAAAHREGVRLIGLAGAPDRVLPAGWTDDLAWSADGERLVSAGAGKLRLWSAASGAELRAIAVGSGLRGMALEPGGARVATGEQGGAVRIWDLASGAELASWKGIERWDAGVLTWTPEGHLLARAAGESALRAFDPLTGAPAATLPGEVPGLNDVALAAHAPRVAWCELTRDAGLVSVIDRARGSVLAEWRDPALLGIVVALTPDGEHVIVGERDGRVHVRPVEPRGR